MSLTSTQITVVGRLVTDIDTRTTQTGSKVANFRIACQERNYDKTQGLWADGDRLYMTITCWEAMAERAVDCLRKGDQVVVHGRLKLRDYMTKEGANRTTLEVNARAIGPDLAFQSVMVNRQDWSISPHQQKLEDSPPAASTDDDSALTQAEVVQAA